MLPIFALLLLAPARGQEKDPTLNDDVRLKNAFQGTEGASLVKFLSTRAVGEVAAEKLSELIEALDGKEASTRQKACAELVAIGAPALPALRQAARDVDTPGAAVLAKRCLGALENDSGALTAAAVRLLAARRPEGTAKALLDYLPHAESDVVREELKTALAAVAFEKGGANPALLQALSDEHPVRRAGAIIALCSQGRAEPRAALRKLLSDPSPSVRFQASLALAQAHDAKAVSTLVTLLADLPIAQAREVERFLKEMAGDLAPKIGLGEDDVSRLKARDEWAKWWLATEGPGLLDEIKKRTLTEADITSAQNQIEKLGDDSFEVRQKAEEAIKKMGARVVPLLRQALVKDDLEIKKRVGECIVAIEKDKTTPLSPVLFRLIALRRPKDSLEALIGFAPFSDDEAIAEEVQTAVNALAFPGGKVHPAVVKALSDKVPTRRAVAGIALCSGPLGETLPLIRAMLKKEKEGDVRLKVALALAAMREPDAVPTLIALVAELPGEQSSMAEEYLMRLARDTAPTDLPDGDANRKKRSENWDKWWTANKAKLVLNDRLAPVSRPRFMGYTLLIQANNNQIVEWDKDRKVRWTITGLLNPWDAQVLPGNRVLIAEYNGQRVTERNLKGDILWQVAIPSWPQSAERLASGRTFVTCRNMLVEYDRGGRQVFKYDRPANDILSARRLGNGQIVVVTANRQILRLDRTGKEIKTTQIPNVVYNQNEILDNGNVLIPMGWQNYVGEYNGDGKEVWRANVMQAMHAFRLPNGNTLIASQNWPMRIYEVDKKGTQIADHQTNGQYIFRVKRR